MSNSSYLEIAKSRGDWKQYQASTSREIPLVIMSADEEIDIFKR